jgi:hypothetical protein
MPAALVCGMSVIAFRNFFLYYWRSMTLETVQSID